MLFRAATLLLSLLIAVSFFSCGKDKSSEEEIREYFATIEKHMESRNAGRVKKHISDTYRDKYNHTKRDLIRIAAGYLIRHQSVHLRHHIVVMDLDENDTRANITIDVAVSQEPLSENDLRLLRADFHRFKVILEKEREWLLQSLVWQRLSANEFMTGMEGFPQTKN